MITDRPTISIRVDVTNPGQFFACCGLLELAQRLCPGAEAWFASDEFHISRNGNAVPPLPQILRWLSKSPIRADGSRAQKALRPVCLTEFALVLDWWIDSRGDKTPLKLWAGQQSSSDILKTLQDAIQDCEGQADQVFDMAKPLTGRFGLDPRAAWNALDTGFSPNEQGMGVGTYPGVELLAAVGLQRCRPVQRPEGVLLYATWAIPLAASLAPAACAGVIQEGGGCFYAFRITTRGSYKGFDFATPFVRR